ncbi:MAG TPA: lytic transglycosylase domain-containing protein [Pseudobdellovibrionaceae bacterium]|nr:lytic transglycosylase domain-containing protein [Pseudobdellovibrionaceae bacterium]
MVALFFVNAEALPSAANRLGFDNPKPLSLNQQNDQRSDQRKDVSANQTVGGKISLKDRLELMASKTPRHLSSSLIFDLPVTYNAEVTKWITNYQTVGRTWFRKWLERSYKYLPFIQEEFRSANIPTDLAYMAMIESGFSLTAKSSANAVGPWQFIQSTGVRYGLKVNWWLDERRDLHKSTQAAIKYLRELYQEFDSWYLVAASYNMGEAGLARAIKKHGTRDYWTLVRYGAIPPETREYVPKMIAAILISKAPHLYGFRDIEAMDPIETELISVRGGTDLTQISERIGVTLRSLVDLNSELLLARVPIQVENHFIRVPKGANKLLAQAHPKAIEKSLRDSILKF